MAFRYFRTNDAAGKVLDLWFGPSIDSMLSQPPAEGNRLFGGKYLTNSPREASVAPAA
jgi:hypothetical protein